MRHHGNSVVHYRVGITVITQSDDGHIRLTDYHIFGIAPASHGGIPGFDAKIFDFYFDPKRLFSSALTRFRTS